ncbi:MAG: hypothetical protein Q7J16_07940 [Candidatus Cloacimonadales bacterium]|nr:hypothetical protein [Candidatus Cloacimonadales bacterium]
MKIELVSRNKLGNNKEILNAIFAPPALPKGEEKERVNHQSTHPPPMEKVSEPHACGQTVEANNVSVK